MNGSHVMALADRGSILVLSENYIETSMFSFSWDEGLTFTHCDFSQIAGNLYVIDIYTNPDPGSQEFLLYGMSTVSQTGSGYILHMDFSQMHQRQCQGADKPDTPNSDFETWYSADTKSGSCLLGQKNSIY
jgi:hypothetical protein